MCVCVRAWRAVGRERVCVCYLSCYCDYGLRASERDGRSARLLR